MNLVVLPLAGVSQTLFWQYREFMPSLWRLFDHSISFSKFYCASTSAFQSFCDFLYGDSVGLDHNLTYPTAPGCLLGQSEKLLEILSREGYSTLGI
ncbi:MAG: hypothetical protein LUH04_15790, partial [Clostridium sp.]|nr:hypothetical protein [Clostridium sp.]